ncbi:pectate lyase [Chitinophaga agri]|uniref:Pectate lyase n=1 Tax=Chitinophaga agri TaxID=2703787 RepID=A0A6B9ZHV9_9BACT|nr:pectate lyase [Chitinophaga agri]QHS61646.1 pectate lyase [Chitinophaga agri]
MKTNKMLMSAVLAGALAMGCTKDHSTDVSNMTPDVAAAIGVTPFANVPITATIVVKAGQTYDGKGNTIIAQGLGDGSQSEGQKPIFKLENGAVLKNVKIGAPGCDGVHVYGNATLENVEWLDVGEDAMTLKSAGTVTLNNCIAQKAADKVLQINADGTININNFRVTTFGKVLRTNGSGQYNVTVNINGGTFSGGTNIVRTESKNLRVRYRNITTSSVTKLWEVPSASQVSTY